jgi:hypothetical protein
LVPRSSLTKSLFRWIGKTDFPRLNYSPSPEVASLQVKGHPFYSIFDIGKRLGLKVSRLPEGLVYLGEKELSFSETENALRQSVITLFDTPEKFADPEIVTLSIPSLKRQGKWTDHVKVTPDQLKNLNGPETDGPTVPKTKYHEEGFYRLLLGSDVPAPGVYPRLLFSERDLPMLSDRLQNTTAGQMSLIEMKFLFEKTWWNPETDDGQIFKKLATGETAGLEWLIPAGKNELYASHQFKGQKPGIYNSHIAYVPECLTAMALYSLLTGDEEHGRQAAAAIANYYRLREPLIDEWLKISDSEFGSSLVNPDGTLFDLGSLGARTHWRNIHGIVAHMNLGLSLDFAGKWMTHEQKEVMRRVIAKSTYGRRSHGQDGPVRFRDVNWMAWDLPHYLAVAAIEGLPGFDVEAYRSGAESVRAFCDWGIDEQGVIFESTGKNPGALQFQLLSMITLARRGENLFAHPHWRKLVEGSIQMTSPTGRVMVNSGTQYSPYSRQKLSPSLVSQLKTFYPGIRLPDYWLSTAFRDEEIDPLELTRFQPRSQFSAKDYLDKISRNPRLRLPSITYPGFVRAVLYDGDPVPTSRQDLDLPLDFHAPTQGVFASSSDRTPNAAWIHLYVRPHHYLGGGHHHADAGMFHFSALGVDWFTQSPFHHIYDGQYFNLVQVDGVSEPTAIPGGPLGYNGAATCLGSTSTPNAAAGSADLTYAYTWRWNSQPPQIWSEELKAMHWELDPSPELQKIWAGTSRYKLRPWWANYTYSNYIPTCRAPFNPMQHVFRTTALVRGNHAYGLVMDDLKKDEGDHLYQWAAMLNGGVWKTNATGLPENQILLGYRPGDPEVTSSLTSPEITPQAGEPLLLVCALGMSKPSKETLPLIKVERVEGPKDKKGVAQYYNRLMISQKAKEVILEQ